IARPVHGLERDTRGGLNEVVHDGYTTCRKRECQYHWRERLPLQEVEQGERCRARMHSPTAPWSSPEPVEESGWPSRSPPPVRARTWCYWPRPPSPTRN